MQKLRQFWLLLVVVSFLGPVSPIKAQSEETEVVRLYGCAVAVLAPELVGGDMVARVDLDCPLHLKGRRFATTLQQRDSDGSFRDVPQVFSTLEALNRLHGSEGLGEFTADSYPTRCRPVDGTQEFRTSVKIRGGKGEFTELQSEPVEFTQDCFGGALKTTSLSEAEINAAGCTLPPLSVEDVDAMLRSRQAAPSTPAAPSADNEVDRALSASSLHVGELPAGGPADPDAVSAITDLEADFAACYNLGELRRLIVLVAPDLQQTIVGTVTDPDYFEERWATPYPYGGEDDIPTVGVTDVRLFPDGRAGAVVDWGRESNFRVYELIDGQWRLSDEVTLYG